MEIRIYWFHGGYSYHKRLKNNATIVKSAKGLDNDLRQLSSLLFTYDLSGKFGKNGQKKKELWRLSCMCSLQSERKITLSLANRRAGGILHRLMLPFHYPLKN